MVFSYSKYSLACYRLKTALASFACLFCMLFSEHLNAAAWDLHEASFDTQANFVSNVTFIGASAITYDFLYNSDSPAIVSIELKEFYAAGGQDIDFDSIKIESEGFSRLIVLSGTGADSCGDVAASGDNSVIWKYDGAATHIIVAGVPISGSGLKLTLSGSVTGAGVIKGSYFLRALASPVGAIN